MRPALFESFPILAEKVPVLDFARLPTPVQRLASEQKEVPQSLWIKRDDLSHPQYGGNKVRKLEFILAEALQAGVREIVSFGAIGTNHGLATALFCKQYGLALKLYLFDQPVTQNVKQNLLCMQSLGAELRYCGTLASTVLAFYFSKLTHSRKRYHLFAGGSNIAGCIGFVSAAFELKQQILDGALPKPEAIICPVGSSATMAGLTLGCALAGLDTQVLGVRVAPSHLGPIPTCTEATVQKLMKRSHQHLGDLCPELPPVTLPRPRLIQGYYGGGYGHPLAKGEAARHLFDTNGIPLDSTYSAKAAAFTLDFCAENPRKNLLYWHTYNSADTSALCNGTGYENLPIELQNAVDL